MIADAATIRNQRRSNRACPGYYCLLLVAIFIVTRAASASSDAPKSFEPASNPGSHIAVADYSGAVLDTVEDRLAQNQIAAAISLLDQAIDQIEKLSQSDLIKLADLLDRVTTQHEDELSSSKKAQYESIAENCLRLKWEKKSESNTNGDNGPSASSAFFSPASLRSLETHVVSIANNGLLADTGRMTSSREQVSTIFAESEKVHGQWIADGKTKSRDILIYAHGGLTSEASGLSAAKRHLGLWMDANIYPIDFVWRTGLSETLKCLKADRESEPDAASGFLTSVKRATILLSPKLVEKAARRWILPVWSEMKKNALAISSPVGPDKQEEENRSGPVVAAALRKYADAHPGEVRIHLLGHSAGSIVLAGFLQNLKEQNLQAESVSFLAPAICKQTFDEFVVPRLNDGTVKRFYVFNLDNRLESSDLTGIKGVAYPGSLLILVSHALEDPASEVPIVGITKDLINKPCEGNQTMSYPGTSAKITLIVSPAKADNPDCGCKHHGGFDVDPKSMQCVINQIHGTEPVLNKTDDAS